MADKGSSNDWPDQPNKPPGGNGPSSSPLRPAGFPPGQQSVPSTPSKSVTSSPAHAVFSPSSRREKQVSDESEPALRPIIKGFFRVTAGELRPLPLESSLLDHGLLNNDQLKRVKLEVFRILEENGVRKPAPFNDMSHGDDILDGAWYPDEDEDDHISIINRHYPGDVASGWPTVLVESDWHHSTSSANWPSTVLQLHMALSAFEEPVQSLEIELTAAYLTRKRFVYPIVGDGELANFWNTTLARGVHQEVLQSFNATRGHVNGMVLSRYGWVQDATRNPITLFITLDEASDETEWMQIAERVRSYITNVHKVPRTIEVWLEHNSWESSAFQLVPPTTLAMRRNDDALPYRQKPDLGADLGASRYVQNASGRYFNPTMGTLGCYVTVKYRGEDLTLVLTNYHVVRPLLRGFAVESSGEKWRLNRIARAGTVLEATDRRGFAVEMESSLTVEHPSRYRHNMTISQLQLLIDGLRKSGAAPNRLAKYEKEMRDKVAFFDGDKHEFARLWAASGFRSQAGRQLDWALLRVLPGREGTNALPDDAAWNRANRSGSMPGEAALDRLQNPQPDSSIAKMKAGTEVWKMGAKSGPTCGTYNEYYAFCGIPEAKYLHPQETMEHQFVASHNDRDTPLGVPGDSGAIVYDNKGVAVGLLFRGLTPNGAAAGSRHTLVTPIEDVFADIKAMTGVDDIKVP